MSYVTIPDTDVDQDSPVTVALMTALRDNPTGISQRSSGAPKIYSVPYDVQIFSSSGTWTKPTNAESGDIVIVHVVGGGGAGPRSGADRPGGCGGGGNFHQFDDIDTLGATETVVVGAGGAGATSGTGADGGSSTFGTTAGASDPFNPSYMFAGGGDGGTNSSDVAGLGGVIGHKRGGDRTGRPDGFETFHGGVGNSGGGTVGGGSSVYGGGGGGGISGDGFGGDGKYGGASAFAGRGGESNNNTSTTIANYDIDGEYGGGGGAAVNTDSTDDTVGGSGGDGFVKVYCIKET